MGPYLEDCSWKSNKRTNLTDAMLTSTGHGRERSGVRCGTARAHGTIPRLGWFMSVTGKMIARAATAKCRLLAPRLVELMSGLGTKGSGRMVRGTARARWFGVLIAPLRGRSPFVSLCLCVSDASLSRSLSLSLSLCLSLSLSVLDCPNEEEVSN